MWSKRNTIQLLQLLCYILLIILNVVDFWISPIKKLNKFLYNAWIIHRFFLNYFLFPLIISSMLLDSIRFDRFRSSSGNRQNEWRRSQTSAFVNNDRNNDMNALIFISRHVPLSCSDFSYFSFEFSQPLAT